MRLTPDQQQLVDEHKPESKTLTGLQQALALAADGWHVFPLRPGSKEPLLPRAHRNDVDKKRCRGECGLDGHGAWDGTTDEDKIRKWWSQHPNAGIGANLGDDRIAFDVDVQHGGRFYTAFPDTRRHLSGRGNGNAHLIYRFELGSATSRVKSGNSALGQGVDIKTGRGSYIVMPGTRHEETGRLYTVAVNNDGNEHLLTDGELQAIYDEAGVTLSATSRGAHRGLTALTGGKVTQAQGTLARLLSSPPTRGEGRTNDWLTQVAGHYAKMHRDKRDLYEVEVRRAIQMVDPNYEDTDKVLESVWATEHEAHPERDATIDNGFLTGDRRGLFCQVVEAVGDGKVYTLAPYGNFDIEALGVAVDEQQHRNYWVRIFWAGQQVDTTLPGELLGDDRAVRRWLARFGANYSEPPNAFPKLPVGTRLQRYLEAQRPAEVHVVPVLGWSDELNVFVTLDGVITATGPATKEESGVVADPKLVERDLAPFKYGFDGSMEEARSVLSEVLTFQDEQVVSLFGAWWAACLLKPQLQTKTSLFPFFGVEAASESGKTNGFFRLMVALNGNTRGHVAPTRPVLRDLASSNRNGIVWADDLDDLSAYGEILRASTSNGTASKMDIDRNGIKNTQIVAPILISGEQLGMSTQKALADRAIVLEVPSPTDRRSLRDPSRPQWDDVIALVNRYSGVDGLSVLAGWYQAFAQEQAESVVSALVDARRRGRGRHGDKHAVLVAGARLLDSLLGDEDAWAAGGVHTQRVLAWVDSDEGHLSADNSLTMEILPWALRTFHVQGQPVEHLGRFSNLDTPAYIRELGEPVLGGDGGVEVWLSSSLLFDAWARDRNHRVDARTATKMALQQQADRVTVPGSSKAVKVSGTSRVVRYRKLLPEYAELVLSRVNAG